LKKFIVALVYLFFFSVWTFAQKPKVKNDPNHDDRPIHFGFSLGINTMDYKITQNDYAKQNGIFVDVKNLSPGINIHAIANLRLADNFDLRALPGISFGERLISFSDIKTTGNPLIYEDGQEYKSNSAYIEMPLLLKYKSQRLNNFRPYLIGGGNFRYDLSVKSTYNMQDQLMLIKPFDVYGEIGFGIDFYLVYFKFAAEIKYSIGLTNILRRTDSNGQIPPEMAQFTNSIDKINSHIVIISFHFE
jgi:hypothetical protein